jgi:hypothetical protein
MGLRWDARVIATEGSPLLFCASSTYGKWRGNAAAKEKPSDYDRIVLDEGFDDPVDVVKFGRSRIGLIDTDGGGPYDIGVDEREVVIAGFVGDYDDDETLKASMADSIGRAELEEFHAGDLELGEDGLVIADSASPSIALELPKGKLSARAFEQKCFFAPLPRGRYVVLEGAARNDKNWEARWCRLVPEGTLTRPRRPKVADDPVASIM